MKYFLIRKSSRLLRVAVLAGLVGVGGLFATAAGAQPTFTKVFTPSTIGPGSVSTITFTITNNSGSPVTGLAFSDTLPAAVTIADPANASTDCDLGAGGSLSAPDGGSTISLSGAQIGGSQSCTVTVDVTASTPGMHTNPAVTLSSSAGSSMSLAVDLTVAIDRPGFSKSFSPSSVSLGSKSTVTFTIDNTANGSTAFNLTFTDNLPIGMVVANPANAATTCTGGVLTAGAGSSSVSYGPVFSGDASVAAGATCTVTVDVVSTGVGMLDNVTGELTSFSGLTTVSSGKSSDTLEVTVTPLALTKAFTDDPVPPGGTVTLEFTITNFDRNFPATGVALTDDLTTLVPALAGLTFSSLLSSDCGGMVSGVGGTTIGLTGATLAPEASCTLRVSLSVPAGATPGAYTNTTGAVTGTVDGSPVVGNMAADDLFVEPVPLLTKEFLEDGTLAPDPVVGPGDDVILRFTITNTSTTSGATDIAFIDELTDNGPGTGFLPFPVPVTLPPVPNPPCGAGSSLALISLGTGRQGLSLTGGSLAAVGMPGDSCAFDVTITIPTDFPPGLYLNTTEEITATVDGATRTGEPASDTLTVIAAPTLTKSFTDDPVAPGDTVTLEFTLNYSGNATADATGISFTDDLTFLAGLTANLPPSPDPPCGAGSSLTGSAGDTLLTLMGGTLMPGESCTFSVTLDVPAGAAPGSHTNTTSGVAATVGGLAATSAAASDDLEIAGLVFTKEFLGDPVIPGDTITLRFTIENIHPTDNATLTLFTDNLAAVLPGTPDLSTSLPPTTDTCGGTPGLIGSTFSYSGGSLTAGFTCTIEISVLVPAGAADGDYLNLTSSLTATQSGGTVVIDPADDTLTVSSNLLQVTKEFLDDPVAPGDTVTLEFVLTNLDASQAASGVGFSDDLGAALTGLTFDSVLFDDCLGTVSGTGTDMITVSGVSLAAGSSCTLRVSLTVPGAAAAGVYTNTTSSVTGTIGGLAVNGDAASDDLEVLQLLTFSKSFDGPTTATGSATLTFTITNPGPNTATGIGFTDDLDAVIPGLIATSLPAVPCGAGSSITGISFLVFSGGELPPSGGMCSFDVDVLVPVTATAGTFPNTTSDLQQGGLKVSDPATADLTIEPAPNFAKVFAPDTILAGGVSTLTFTIDNSASTLAAAGLDFTDNLPAGVAVATPSVTNNTCGGTLTATAGATSIALTGGAVAAGAACTIDVDVTSTTAGMHVNTTGDLTSSSGNSGTASDTLTVSPAADLSVTKTDGVTSATPGGSVTYTIVVSNAGPSADPSVTLSDAFPTPPLTCTYTSVAAGGATGNTAAGSGDLAETLSMPAGSSVTYTAICAIDSDATGTLSNTATVTSSVTDTVPGNNSATDSDTVLVPEADIAVTKDDGVTSAAPGDSVTYTIVVSNTGPSDDPSVSLTDTFPAPPLTCSYTSVAAGGATGNTAAGSGDLAETLSMPAGSSVTYTVTCDIDSDATGTLSNTATASGSVTDPDSSNNSATDSDTVLVPEADLSVTKDDGVTSAVPGESVTYTIEVSNTGPSDDPSVSLTDTFPAVLTCTYTSGAAGGATGNTAAGSGDLAETLSMPAGSSVTYTVTCDIDSDATGTLSNTATASGSVTDPDGGNDSATDADTVLVPEADLSVTKDDGVTSAVPGESVTYTIEVSNAGPSDDPSVSLTDTFPAVLACTYTSAAAGGASGNTAMGAGDLAETLSMPAGSSVTYTVTCDIDSSATGTLSNTVTVTASVTDPDGGNNSATDADTVLVPEADLSVTKTDGVTSAVPGQTTLVYTIVAANAGPSDDPSASLTDTFPASLTCTYTSVAAGGATGNTAAGSGNLAETLSMPAGSSVTYTVTCDIDSSATGTLSNTATVIASVTDPNGGNNSSTDADTVLVPEADLSLDKNDGVVAVTPGDNLTYTLTVTNNGPSDSSGGTVSDVLPAGLSFVSSASGCTEAAGTVTCPFGAVAAGDSVVLTFVALVDAGQTSEITNTATVSGNETDPETSNDSATHTTPLVPRFTKEFSPNPILALEVTTLTFTVDNTGSSLDATALDFTDSLPAGLEVAAPPSATTTCTGGTLTAAAGATSITYTGGTVAAGATCTVSVDVTAPLDGVFVNTTGDLTSSLGNSGAATDTLTVDPLADLEVIKAGVSEPATAGGHQIYPLVVTNLGPSTATDVELVDVVPAESTFVVADPAAACVEAGGVVTCDLGDLASGESAAVFIRVRIDPDAPDPVANVATVSSAVSDPDAGNNDAMVSTTVLPFFGFAMLDDLNGNGFPEVAVTLPGSIQVLVKDVESGAVLQNEQVLPPDFTLVAFDKTPDLNGNGTEELAVVARSQTSGNAFVRVRDGLTGKAIANPTLPAGHEALAMTVVADDGFGNTVLAIAARNNATGQSFVFKRNAADASDMGTIPIALALWPIDLATVPNFSGDPGAELATLAVNTANGARRIQIKELSSGAFLRLHNLPSTRSPAALEAVSNCCGAAADELATLAWDQNLDRVRVRTIDADSAGLVSDATFAVGAEPAGLRMVPHFADASADEIAALYRLTGTRAAVRVRDAQTATQLMALGVGIDSSPLGLAVAADAYDTIADEIAVLWVDNATGVITVTLRDAGSSATVATVPIP